MQEKMNIAEKLILNEKGEISLTKIGIILAAIGGALTTTPLPPVEITGIIAKWLIAIGGMCSALGALSKRGR